MGRFGLVSQRSADDTPSTNNRPPFLCGAEDAFRSIHTFVSPVGQKRLLTSTHQVGHVHRHFLDLRAVELLDLTHCCSVLLGNEVDRDTFAAESSTTTDTMDVVLLVRREIVAMILISPASTDIATALT